MPTLSLTFTGLTGRGPFSLSAIAFSQAVPVEDQIEVVKNGITLGAVAYATVPDTTSLVLAAGYDLVPSDTLVVTRVTDQVNLYSQYSAYGPAPAEGTILNNQQFLFVLQELRDQVDNYDPAITGETIENLTLGSLKDTNVTGAANGQILTYDSVTTKWVPTTIEVDKTLDSLTDTNLDGVTNGQILAYDDASSKWVPTTIEVDKTLDSLTDTDVGGVADREFLSYNYASSKWVPTTIEAADLPTLLSINGNDTTIQIAHKASSAWETENQVLAFGEIGYETDTGKIKIGDGVTNWIPLPYFATGEGGGGGGGDLSDGDYGDITVSNSGTTWTIDGIIQSPDSTNSSSCAIIASYGADTTFASGSAIVASTVASIENLSNNAVVMSSLFAAAKKSQAAVISSAGSEAQEESSVTIASSGTTNDTPYSLALGYAFAPFATLGARKIHLFGQTGNTYQAGSLMFGATNWSSSTPSGGATLTFSGGSTALSDGSNTATLMDSSGNMTVAGDRLRITTSHTPATASDTGTPGQIAWDNDYLYVCVGANSWKRSALSTW